MKGLKSILFFALLLLTARSPSAMGAVISQIEIPGVDVEVQKRIRLALGLRIGERLNGTLVREGIKRLHQEGLIDALFLFTSSPKDKNKVQVRIMVTLIHTLRSIAYEGVPAEIQEEITSRLKVSPGDLVGTQTVSILKEYVKQSLADTGYQRAQIEVTQKKIPGTQEVDITVKASLNEPTRIRKIVIQGGPAEEVAPIRNQLKMREGDPFSRRKLNESMVEINAYLTGNQYFTSKIEKTETIVVDEGNQVDLVVYLKLGNRYQFQTKGNTVFDNYRLRELMTEQLLIQLDAPRRISELIEKKYREVGYHFCQVETTLEENEAEGLTTVRFEIEEGPKVYIDRLVYLGSSPLSAEVLNEEFYQDAPGVVARKIYWENGIDGALDAFQKNLESQGYLRSRALLARTEFTSDRRGVVLYIDLEVGLLTRISKIAYSSMAVVHPETVKQAIGVKVGDPVNKQQCLLARKQVLDLYRDRGYIDASFYVSDKNMLKVSGDNLEATLQLDVDPGNQFYIGRIDVEGNLKTQPKVIFRELEFKTGDLYVPSQVALSQENLSFLGLFSRVDIVSTSDIDNPYVKNIRIVVRESKPGLGEVGLGGVYEDPRFRVRSFGGIAYKNLLGLNHTLAARGQLLLPISSQEFVDFVEYNTSLRYRTPYPFDIPLIFESALGFHRLEVRRLSSGPEIQTQARIEGKIEKRLSKTITGLYRFYRYEQTTTETLDDASTRRTDNIGSTGPGLIVDLRNDTFNPTEGSYHVLDIEFAHPVLLSEPDISFIMATMRNSFYVPLFSPFSLTFFVGGGYARSLFRDHPIPKSRLSGNLSLGGRNSIRGFNVGAFSPPNESKDTFYYNLRMEFQTQLFLGLSGVLFFDTGQIFPDLNADPRHDGVGFGIRYKTPVGPIAIDFGKGLQDDAGGFRFYFTVGTI